MAAIDSNLGDDQVKLVEYSIVWIKRDEEDTIAKGEMVVADNLSDDAFAAWVIARYFQKPDHKPIAEDDKKYLRVCHQVKCRWAKQDRKFEQRQLDVLGGIREALRVAPRPAPVRPNPFDEFMNRLELSDDTFSVWREGFSRCAEQLSKNVAKAFNNPKFRKAGKLEAPRIEPADLEAAFRNPNRFDRSILDMFTGPALGDLRVYVPQPPPDPPQEVLTPPVYSVWGPVVEQDGIVRQEITGSQVTYVDPASPELHRFLDEVKVDLIFNAYTPDLGLVSWSAFYQNHSDQMRSIGYQLGPHRLVWVNQLMNQDMTPKVEGQFVLSLDFDTEEDGKRFFNVYAMHIDFDFDECKAVFAGPVLKMINEVVTL